MKSEVKIAKAEGFRWTYPILATTDIGTIVLFSAYGIGTVIVNANSYSIGEYTTDWCMSCFKPFNGSVELSN